MVKNGWVKTEKCIQNFFLKSPQFFFFKKLCKNMTQIFFLWRAVLSRAVPWVKKPFFSKKCIFFAENDISLKNGKK